MKRYGTIRPVWALINEGLRCVARRGWAMWQQRRVELGCGVRMASSVQCRGHGRIIIGDGTRICRNVVLIVANGGILEIGPGSFVGESCTLEVFPAQHLKLGANFRLGRKGVICAAGGIEWGDNGVIGDNCQIGPRESEGKGRLIAGEDVKIHANSLIDTCADVIIGSHVHSGPSCAWYTHNHITRCGKAFWNHGIQCLPIMLGSRIWVGHGCIFLPGVKVGDDVIIAASAVVTKEVANSGIVGGIPAKQIGNVNA